MESTNALLEIPSPSHSYQYVHGDPDQYFDASRSDTHSSATSPYDMSFPGEFSSTNPYPSPGREREDRSESPQKSPESALQSKPAARRKRENRYKNALPSVLSRRRAQNRASQRAYRERKDQRIKDLEQMLNDAKARNDVLSQAYAELHSEYMKLKTSHINEINDQPVAYQARDLSSYVDPSMGMVHSNTDQQRLDLDMYVYQHMANYSL